MSVKSLSTILCLLFASAFFHAGESSPRHDRALLERLVNEEAFSSLWDELEGEEDADLDTYTGENLDTLLAIPSSRSGQDELFDDVEKGENVDEDFRHFSTGSDLWNYENSVESHFEHDQHDVEKCSFPEREVVHRRRASVYQKSERESPLLVQRLPARLGQKKDR